MRVRVSNLPGGWRDDGPASATFSTVGGSTLDHLRGRTARQQEILTAVAEADSVNEAARKLGITPERYYGLLRRLRKAA